MAIKQREKDDEARYWRKREEREKRESEAAERHAQDETAITCGCITLIVAGIALWKFLPAVIIFGFNCWWVILLLAYCIPYLLFKSK